MDRPPPAPVTAPAPAEAVTALYQAHALGLIRLAVVMLGDRPAAEARALIGEEHREVLTAIRSLPARLRVDACRPRRGSVRSRSRRTASGSRSPSRPRRARRGPISRWSR